MNSRTQQFSTRLRALQSAPLRALLGLALLTAVLLIGVPASALAQSGEGDPPSRVARLSEVDGTVWLYHPSAGDWIQATRNLPLTTGDTLATDPGGRAELQVGSATLRLDAASELQVVVLDDSRISLQLRAGTLAARIRNPAETGPFDLTTEDGRFLVMGAGRYRFDRGSRSSFVSVDAGRVRYEYSTSALAVEAGQRAEFWVDANGAAQYGFGSGVSDAFTAWNNDRDRVADRSVAARYVSPEMTGADDLDRYGNWEQSPEYGAVWFPAAVASDWAPYSSGRWAWVRPWGWTWVDDAPWGFAPFHYGRWVNLRNRWCWTPGVREQRPVYAPALVGWVGAPRGGLSVSVGVGPAVGWFPLAPREVYVPSYRSSPRYARDINIRDVRNVENINIVIGNPAAARDFENRRYPRAVTIVPTTVFAEHRPVGPAAAQYRDAPWARDFAKRDGSAPALTAPPVASPALTTRPVDTRPVRPPPGMTEPRATGPGQPSRGGDREGGQRPGVPPAIPSAMPSTTAVLPQRPGSHDDRGRDREGRADRSGSPAVNGALTAPPAAAAAGTGVTPGLPIQAATPSQVRPLPIRPAGNPVAEGVRQPGAAETRPPVPVSAQQPALPPQQQVAQPQPQEPQRLPPSSEAQDARVRPLPVIRGGERRDDDRQGGHDDRRAPVRGEPAAPPSGRPAPAAEPVQTPSRSLEAPRAPERPSDRPAPTRPAERPQPPPRPEAAPARPEIMAVPRAPEAQLQRAAPVQPSRPVEAAAPRPVEVQRPSPAEPPRAGVPERRNEPNSNR